MSDIAILEHLVYLIRKYDNEDTKAIESYRKQMQLYAVYAISSEEEVSELPKEPTRMEDKATEIIARIKAVLENQSDTK